MKQMLGLICFLMLATSCQYFNTDKISADTFYEDELKTIDWEQVDQYPAFTKCESFTEKSTQKKCFETTVSDYIYTALSDKKMRSHQDLEDTILVNFTISREGKISETNITVDSLTQLSFPLLASWIQESIEGLPTVAPAYKRGIPVKTRFMLPVVIKTSIKN